MAESEKEVGYCKPPNSARWKKGQSGNPRGRPKSKQENFERYSEILSEPVNAKTSNGRTERLGSLEAAYLQQCRKALKGDKAALFSIVNAMLVVVPDGDKAEKEHADEYSGAKRRFLEMAGFDPDTYSDS